MADNLFNALSEFDDSVTQYVKTYSGLLGLPTSNKTVEVPTRNGYVYVRLRDNQSEIIQAYNEKVSPVYNLPVLVRREGNKWVVQGRDIERYENWGSYSAFLPAHAPQHEFDRDNTGGDIVFSYIDQLMPVLAYPSGTDGSGNVLIGGYSFKKNDNTWAYVGNTGTPSLLIYKPTDNQARVVLVYLDRNTGNPGILVNSGTSFSAALTGTHDVLQYIPTFTPVQEPVKVVRLVSGTEQVKWDNLYDVRQFLGGGVTGTGIGEAPIDGRVYGRKNAGWTEVSGTAGSSTPAGSDTEIQINQAGSFGANYNWRYDYTNDVLIYGSGTPPTSAAKTFHIMQDQGSPGMFLWAWQSNSAVAPYIAGFKARGTRAAPQAVEQDDEIFRIRARGYNGVNYTATQAQLLFVAPYNWASGSHPLYASVWTTPSGSAQMQEIIEFTPDGANLQAAKTYDIAAKPEVGAGGWLPSRNNWLYHSSDDPSYVVSLDANVTGTFGLGNKIKVTDGGAEKFFILTGISVSGTTSYLNLYGGTDYDLSGGGVSSPHLSRDKAPYGFPMTPAKWTVTATDNTQGTKNSPSAGTWYHTMDSNTLPSINIPIGVWDVSWQAGGQSQMAGAAATANIRVTLSTANNSESDSDFTAVQYVQVSLATNPTLNVYGSLFRQKLLTLTSKTTYYLNISTYEAGTSYIQVRGDIYQSILKAVCAYL